LVCLMVASALRAQPLRLAVLGDSLSAEYDSLTGIAGVDDPTEYAAVTVSGWEAMSWVEVLGRLRTNEVILGAYRGTLPGWSDLAHPGDLRFTGYEYNFAIPGFEASQFEQIVNSSVFSDPGYLPYKLRIAGVLQAEADAAVVWLGGNEFRANYGYLYDGNDPLPLVNALSSDLAQVIDFVRGEKPGIKLVVVNLPDLGATPDKQAAHPDPLKRANVTAATLLANQAIANLAGARGIPVADVFADTYKLVAGETVWLGPVNLYPGLHLENHPRYQFTRDGLHPNTCLQAIIAARILETFNQAYATGIPAITPGEVLNLIGVDPMQPYLDWASTNSLTAVGLGDDSDLDDLVNIAEFLFGLNPNASSPSPLMIDASTLPVTASYHPDPDRERLVEVWVEWSTRLVSWEAVPAGNLSTNLQGVVTVALLPGHESRFVRLQLSVRPVN
jgi:lysophospholipase L1-like esterase